MAHEDSNSSRGVYNKAEYEPQRRHMLQQWADMIDAWAEGRKFKPEVIPPVHGGWPGGGYCLTGRVRR